MAAPRPPPRGGAPLVLALVARGTTVLAEASTAGGNAGLVALDLLAKLPQGQEEDRRASYVAGQHAFHCLVRGGLAYVCVAGEAAGRRLPFAFLDDVQREFASRHGGEAGSVGAYALDSAFGPVLAGKMRYWATDPRADAIGRVRGDLDQLQAIMVDNIDKVLERGERLELLVERTEDLAAQGFAFKTDARRLKRAEAWRRARLAAGLAALVLALAYLLAAFLCGPRLHC